MPIQTRVLIAVSSFIVAWWAAILGFPVIAGIGLKIGLDRSAELRRKRDHFILEIPVLGDILRKIALARFANTFALMYGAGIPVMDALQHCEEATGNIAVTEAMQRARTLIGQGIPISQAFEASAAFPPLVLRMLKIGEHTGRLDEALRNVSYFYSRDVNEGIGKLQSMIEPMLTVVMGGLLGWIMVAVLGPVYDTISNLPM
jgi:type IV pilus assembly protein PilC